MLFESMFQEVGLGSITTTATLLVAGQQSDMFADPSLETIPP